MRVSHLTLFAIAWLSCACSSSETEPTPSNDAGTQKMVPPEFVAGEVGPKCTPSDAGLTPRFTCPEGLRCSELVGTFYCVKHTGCEAIKCPEGASCLALGSYPEQVLCVP